jgi:hypothetical protein
MGIKGRFRRFEDHAKTPSAPAAEGSVLSMSWEKQVKRKLFCKQ